MKRVKQIQEYIADEELARRYRKSREMSLLSELYGRYMPMVYGVALKYLKRPEDAQDAVMQLFEDLVESLKIHQVQKFKPWLYTCVRNHCLMELRRKNRDLSITLDDSFMDLCVDLHLEERKEDHEEAVRECVEALPEKQRACVNAFFFEELSYKEVGTRTGFSLKNVKSFIQNGKRNLKSCLERKGVLTYEPE
ncbi:MAG: sigma-70 family RNA polymerase sigma factor [Odoribacteraceae bacterium]|jgi:RNA polymerase sigma-70 factor (ECF subfamily)|nr:sigma-70 family RNA polymerase sigma factor [Odoribacteraceae bacterium]